MEKSKLTIETYLEFQYLLSHELDFLTKNILSYGELKIDCESKRYLDNLGLKTIFDLINASHKKIEALYQNEKLYTIILRRFARINRDYVYSFTKDNCVTAPYTAKKILVDGSYSFLNQPINYALFPRLSNRLKKTMDRVNVKTYADLRNFLTDDILIDIKGLGLDSYCALVTIIISDYKLLENYYLLNCEEKSIKQKTILQLFEELLNESCEKLEKNMDIVFLEKWTWTFDNLKNDLIHNLNSLYGEDNADIILNSFVPKENQKSQKDIAIEKNIDIELVLYAENELKEDYLSAFADINMINSNDGNRANKFFRRLIKLGKDEMAPFIGVLYSVFPAYPEIFDRISEAFPNIGIKLQKIKKTAISIAIRGEA